MSGFFEKLWQIILDSNLLNLAGAIGILLIGWLIALWVSRRVSIFVRRWTAKHPVPPDCCGASACMTHAETAAGRIVYYIILIFTVLGCFSVLNLEAAAAPLKDFMSAVINYIPNILGALLLVLAARVVGGIVRSVVRAAMMKSRLHERLAAQCRFEAPDRMAEYTAQTLYYTVFLFFLPAILNVLKIYGITGPLQSMFEKVMVFLPRLLAAAAILFIGMWIAKLVRKAVSGLVVISRLNELGEKAGVTRIFGNSGLAAMTGSAAYALVAVPVVIAALTALQIEPLSQSVAGFFEKILNASGNIIGAGVIILAAALAGGFASSLTSQLASNFGVDKLADELGMKTKGGERVLLSAWLGKLVFAVIMILALLAACDTLHFSRLADLIRDFAAFGGNVLVSIAVMLVGIWLANFAASAVAGKCNELLTAAVRLTVIIFTAAIAVENMNIGGTIVDIAFTLILGAVCVAAAIAFGIGGREAAAILLKDLAAKLRK